VLAVDMLGSWSRDTTCEISALALKSYVPGHIFKTLYWQSVLKESSSSCSKIGSDELFVIL